MLEVAYDGNVAKIDVRERIRKGEHPKNELMQFVRDAARGTVIEIHLPYPAPPLVAALDSIGVQAVVNELGREHFRILCVKM